MTKSAAMSRCQGYIATVKKGKKKKTKNKKEEEISVKSIVKR